MTAPWFGTVIADNLNLLCQGHLASGAYVHSAFPAAHFVNLWTIYNTAFDGGPNANTVSLGALATAPDGTNTAQKVVEAVNNGVHQMQTVSVCRGPFVFNGTTLRLSVIAKAAERTRIALQYTNNSGPTSGCGVVTVFDLAGGQIGVAGRVFGSTAQQDANGEGYRLHAVADSITALGSGWFLCSMDFQTAYNNGQGVVLYMLLDNGAGLAAQSTSYVGDGASGVLTWRSSMLPPRAYQVTQRTFFDDFNSLSTIDLANTRAQGFNWYINNLFPHFPIFTPSNPADFSVASSVLTIAGTPNIANILAANTCAVPPGGATYVGNNPNYVGRAFTLPALFETKMHWDANSAQQTTASFWNFNVDSMFNLGGGTDIVDDVEVDYFENALPSLQDAPRTGLLGATLRNQDAPQSFAKWVSYPPDAYSVWSTGPIYLPPMQVFFNGVFYTCLVSNGPGTGPGVQQPDVSPVYWSVTATPTPSLAIDLNALHTYSLLWLLYSSVTDRGIVLGFFDNMFAGGSMYGPDVLQEGGSNWFQLGDKLAYPPFLQTGQNYQTFWDYVAIYQPSQATLSALSVHDSSATPRACQAIDVSAIGTGPFEGSRVTLDGQAGVQLAVVGQQNNLVVDASAAATQPVSVLPSTTGTATSVASSATRVNLLLPNNNRLGASIYNESTQILYVQLPSMPNGGIVGVVTSTVFTIAVQPNTRYELPQGFLGQVNGAWAGVNGFARVTEFT